MNTMDIRAFIQMAFDLQNAEAIEMLSATAEMVTVKRKQQLISMGEVSPCVYVLIDGVLQEYFLDDDGKSMIDTFAWRKGTLITGNADLNQPSLINISALKTCHLLAIPLNKVVQLVETDLGMSRIYSKKLCSILKNRMEEKMLFHFSTPQRRYLWMKKTFPEWDGLIPDKYLASFLHMTPVTYSRTKKKVERGQAEE